MKVLLVYPDVRGPLRVHPRGYFYNGIACISALLKREGHDVRFLHYLSEPSRDRFDADVLLDPPDLVGYSATTNLFSFVHTWSTWCRERFPDLVQICGGVHPTLDPDASLTNSELNAVCVGEGEWPMIELCDRLERDKTPYKGIANFVFKDRNGRLQRNPPRPLMTGEELDAMPFADRLLFEPGKICDPNRPIVIASRGCPFGCTYCCNRALMDALGKAKAVRLRSVDKVVDEINHIRKGLPDVDGIHFDDDIFGMRLPWMRRFVADHREQIRLPFSCNIRPDLAGDEVVRLLARGGCDEVAMGVETGNPNLRRKLLGRKIDDRLLIDAYRRFEEAGIRAHAFNMVGVPHERMENSLETIKLNAALKKKWKMEELRITIFHPYVGTPLFDEARRHGMLTDRSVTCYADDTVLNLGTMSGHQIRFVARYFRLLVVVYQKLLHGAGRPGRLAAWLLDRLLLSRFAATLAFPAANSVYPRLVTLARWIQSHQKETPGRRARSTCDDGEAAPATTTTEALHPVAT